MNQATPAARLHVMTATQSTSAVILRRGPHRSVASIGWDRSTNTFTMGQWLRGRIYEFRSDLSPDGRQMIYFAGTQHSIKNGTYHTCVSRAPFLHGIVYLPQSSTYYGGGAFTDDGRVFLNGGGDLPENEDGLQSARPSSYPSGTDGFWGGDLFASMMERRGWESSADSGYDIQLTKSLTAGWQLNMRVEMRRENRSLVSLAYSLAHPSKPCTEQPTWEWAEPWKDGIHFAANGGVWFSKINAKGDLLDCHEIRNFKELKFQRLRAPYDTRPPNQRPT